MSKVYKEPSIVTAEDGHVFLDGPDGVAVAVTPDAALEMSHRLREKAAQAEGQKIDARYAPEEDGEPTEEPVRSGG